MRKLKIGIDVGGTFTHAVAIDIHQHSLVGKACVPTTHGAAEGVAKGVVDSLHSLLKASDIAPEEVILIAHSTTQATNALLEGDVAKVGIIGLGSGLEGLRARQETHLNQIELAPGKFLPTHFRFIDTGKQELNDTSIRALIRDLAVEGAEVFVASEAFGVDQPEREDRIVQIAESMGFLATAASRISRLYGLRVRTRTAVLNASMMPKMLETANMTEKAIRESGIQAPLMVMRSDGGIMDIAEMRKRPILTMLSGPAAGVAAALMFARVSDGIFIEVGGTSSDISVIRNGKPQIKSAQIAGQRLYVQTLDVRTLGIAGGSIPRIKHQTVHDVGPRSAHIAALAYPAYAQNPDFSLLEIELIQPKSGDPSDYLVLKRGEERYTLTPTEASWYLKLVKEAGHGEANQAAVNSVIETLAQKWGISGEALARSILSHAAEKIRPVLKQLMREYKLTPALTQLVGGGGGASALVPFTAQAMQLPHFIAEHAEVISAIGAALGMIRDSVERNLLNPSNEEILSLRQQALDSVVAMGAIPETVEVSIEIDSQNRKVRAIAMGSSDMRSREAEAKILSEQELIEKVAQALQVQPQEIQNYGASRHLYAMGQAWEDKRLFGLYKRNTHRIRVVDNEGTIRLQLQDAQVFSLSLAQVVGQIRTVLEEMTSYGDAGGLLPDLYLLAGPRIIDLSGLLNEGQILALFEIETRSFSPDEACVLLASGK
ncbi:hydantoinase [bacterium (Candidatus Blackallbacteria) CG17_big_fil_post_rev_8_21_14_2_50_48_46]|uniref:Hydantoinase n=1 Tax=bacterium (Candidatus Blackallbacteria) CG17_big_fil_post_rev_8_21_14_2_50_48_46 TaxID=2014261 RepID=A0A2M7G848_9BACT|nr:MAG: hydantoinase [bacterium (Candidatus Blackallbacteria) CG18_big_fil_WC_8_21_14_2_50_49_26]PIW18252.1 MAG: hydantoinase [bacterium (Candidatus Blackallbacteria) CG17_big_fil_post_rev_8_21_14_2_50_48_46]PIW50683.1 MAG: hydantoinase [bacterium (Candidatus Blackallbacteria) CG13_big_fil_rev_8_21_14_2_50_49_14]